MRAQRISPPALKKILAGEVKDSSLCILKLYSEMCPKCHALDPFYAGLTKEFPDVYFLAFNVDDDDIESLIGRSITGVPTLFAIRTKAANDRRSARTRVRRLDDPPEPHAEMWYHPSDIRKFIETNLRRKNK